MADQVSNRATYISSTRDLAPYETHKLRPEPGICSRFRVLASVAALTERHLPRLRAPAQCRIITKGHMPALADQMLFAVGEHLWPFGHRVRVTASRTS